MRAEVRACVPPMTEKPLPRFPKLGTTNDLWNDALETAACAVENDHSIPSMYRFRGAETIRKLKRRT